jgi:predicted O-methyltransferase YrrM
MNKQKICVFSVCFNEEDILPFYLDYYINFVEVDKIVIYDGGSTDNTHKLLKEYPQVELIIQKQDGQNDQYLKDTKNNSWKKYKDEFDWVIVCDIDEFLYHPNIQEKLFEYKKNGISIPITKGYDMITLNFPQFIKGNYLPNFIIKGVSDNHWMGKKIIFNPQKIEEINYRFGCHDCDPIGEIKYSDENELFMLHYKWLGHEYLTKRYKFLSDRRSEWNIQNGAGKHFVTNSQITLNEYIEKYNNSTNVLKIKHFYENIDGWFDFKEFYTQMVNKFPTCSHFVEIGAWLGKSTSYMAVEIINSGKNIKFDVIDTWGGSKNFIDEDAYKIEGDPYEIFQQNLLSVKNYINPIKGSSDEIYKLYKDESLDFVFIDAGHDYISVINDIKNWFPKIKKNGILAGHDYYVYPDVKKAVDEYFGDNIKLDNSLNESCGTWIVNLENFNKLNSLKIDNKIFVNDLEQLKISQLNELENFMKIDKYLPYINNKKIIIIENISFENGKVKMLLPYLIEKGYKIENNNDNLILSINKDDDYYDIPLFSILTSCYKKYDDLKNAIESVINQTYTNWEMLICSDGHDEEIKNIVDNYKLNKIKYFSTILTNDYGSTQKNFLTKISTGKYLIYLDDDNIIYPNYLETIINNLNPNIGMVICKIDYDGLNHQLPIENMILLGKIDTLCLCVDKYYTKYAIWKNYAGQDYEFMKICENNIINDNKIVKFIPDILGRHIDKKIENKNMKIKNVIFHHNYLINNWKEILIEQIYELKNSGLYNDCEKIIATIYSDYKDDNNRKIFKDLINENDILNKWLIIDLYKNNFEYEILKIMKNYCDYINENINICYFHTKGVCSGEIEQNIGLSSWRKYLNYFILNKWNNNIEKLKVHDIVCVDYNFNEYHNKKIIDGHFFWTKSEHIKSLPEPILSTDRFYYDSWINSKEDIIIYENFNALNIGYNLYLQDLPEYLYKEKNRMDELLKEKRLSHLGDVGGVNRLFGLKDLIIENLNRNSVVCEIGSFEGKSSELFALLVKSVICVDPWVSYHEINEELLLQSENKFDCVAKRYKNIIKIKGFSVDVSKNFKNESFDCVYIDGDHHYEPVKQDILHWLPKIKNNGFISGHDYNLWEIKKAIDEVFQDIPIKVYSDQSWIVKKDDYVKLNSNKIWNYSNNNFFIQQKEYEWTNFLEYIYSNLKLDNVLEIGSHSLGATSSLVKIFKNVISIDITKRDNWDSFKSCHDNWKYFVGDSHTDSMYNNIKNLNMKFDLIFIDGDHTYLGVKNDFIKYKEFLNNDGIIAFHDILDTQFHRDSNCYVHDFWKDIKNDYEYIEIINDKDEIIDSRNFMIDVPNKNWGGIGILIKNKSIINESNNKISKNVIVMTAHPNYKTSEDITKQAIESLKALNTDIILSCHSPIPLELQNAVKYVIFDKNNPLIKHDYYDHSWFDRDEFYAFINLHKNDNDLQHALAVYINYYNGILHAKSLGYKTAICTNFDIIFDKEDLNNITEKIDEMRKTDKKSFFLTSNANEGIHYKTIFFITDIDFFIENFKYVFNEKDYNKLTRQVGSETNCLENFFFQTLKNSDKLLLQEKNEVDFFSKSKVNLFSNIEYFTILPLRHKPDKFVIWFSSANSLDDNRNICISVTDNTDSIYLKNDIITKNYIFYKSFVFQKNHKYEISCQLTYDNIVKEKVIILNDELFEKINENGDFWDKKLI